MSLKDLARLWSEEGFGYGTVRALGKVLRGRSDSCRYLGGFVAEVSASGGVKTKARGVRGWRMALVNFISFALFLRFVWNAGFCGDTESVGKHAQVSSSHEL